MDDIKAWTVAALLLAGIGFTIGGAYSAAICFGFVCFWAAIWWFVLKK